MFAKEARRADDDVQAVNACVYGHLRIPHIAADVWQKIRQEGEGATERLQPTSQDLGLGDLLA